MLTEGGDPAGARRFDDVAMRALCHPQRVERKRRIELAPDHEKQRNTSRDTVGFGQDIGEGVPGGGRFEQVEIACRAGEVRNPRPWVVAGVREAGFDLWQPVFRPPAQREDEYDTALLDRIGEDLIVVGQFLEARDDRIVGADLAHFADNSRRGRAVRFEEQDIERDRRGSHLVELGDEFGEQGARPRPLSELFEAVVVNIDDANRGRFCRPAASNAGIHRTRAVGIARARSARAPTEPAPRA